MCLSHPPSTTFSVSVSLGCLRFCSFRAGTSWHSSPCISLVVSFHCCFDVRRQTLALSHPIKKRLKQMCSPNLFFCILFPVWVAIFSDLKVLRRILHFDDVGQECSPSLFSHRRSEAAFIALLATMLKVGWCHLNHHVASYRASVARTSLDSKFQDRMTLTLRVWSTTAGRLKNNVEEKQR